MIVARSTISAAYHTAQIVASQGLCPFFPLLLPRKVHVFTDLGGFDRALWLYSSRSWEFMAGPSMGFDKICSCDVRDGFRVDGARTIFASNVCLQTYT
jgi:hypothetical protein